MSLTTRKFWSRYDDLPKPLRKNKYKFILLMLIPSVLSFAVFYVAVNFQSIALAFRQFTGYDAAGHETYIWTWKNFSRIFQEISDPSGTSGTQLLQAVKNTLLLYFCGNAITIPMACFISYMLFKKMLGTKFFRVVFYLPSILSTVVMVIVFKNIVAPNGFISEIAIMFTGEALPPLLAQDSTAIWMVFIYNTWVGFAGPYLLLTAALTRIPTEILESARLDGASAVKEYFKICIPLIWPTLYIILIQKIASILSADGPILLLTNGLYKTYTVGFWSFNQVIRNHSYEFPAAVGILMTLVVAPIAILARNLLSKVYKDVDF